MRMLVDDGALVFAIRAWEWRHGRTMTLGFVGERAPLVDEQNKSLTFKLQWEV